MTDDASEDSTPALLDAFAARAPFPVRVERFDERRGHVEGFLHAARLCRGEAIAFCDADDVWREDKLELCGRALAVDGTALVLHTARVVDADLNDMGFEWPRVGRTRRVPPLGLTGLEVHAPNMAIVFRRELLDVASFETRPPSRYGLGRQMVSDEWVQFLAGVLGTTSLLAEPLVLYRRHGANDSPGPLVGRRRRTLRPALEDYRTAAALLGACARYLEDAAAPDPVVAERFSAGARHYRVLAANWALRAALYETASRRRRLRALGRLIRAGAYRRRDPGGFGRPAFVKDALGGVALATTAPLAG